MLGGLIGDGEFQITFGTPGAWLQGQNLRSIMDANYPGVAGSSPVRVVFTMRGNIGGSSNNSSVALRTGSWVPGSEIVLIVPANTGLASSPEGLILGNGGSATRGAEPGSAISLGYNLTIVNNGIIGAGGGAGADRGGPDGNGGGGAGYPGGLSVEGSGIGQKFTGGGGSGGSGWGAGLGMIGGCASYCPSQGSNVLPLIKNGYTLTFDPASTHQWFAGNRGVRANTCDPINNPAHRTAPY
jgi:hypothetical protein